LAKFDNGLFRPVQSTSILKNGKPDSPGPAHLGLRAGLAECGLASTHLELTPALRIALEAPDAAARYLAGEPVFRAAEQD